MADCSEKTEGPIMPKTKQDPEREYRMGDEVIVDAHDGEDV